MLGLGLGFGLGQHAVDEREAFGEERARRARFLDGLGLEGYGWAWLELELGLGFEGYGSRVRGEIPRDYLEIAQLAARRGLPPGADHLAHPRPRVRRHLRVPYPQAALEQHPLRAHHLDVVGLGLGLGLGLGC